MFTETDSLSLRALVLEVARLNQRINGMSEQMTRLIQEVAETKTAVASATALLRGLAAQIRELKDDPVKLGELADSLDADQADIAAAVAETNV